MLRKLLIVGIVITVFVVVINVPYVYEYDEDNLIVRNATGWDREIFSDYKTFELKYSDGSPLFIIPYNLDVDIIDAKFSGGGSIPTAINFKFDPHTAEKTMDILLPQILKPESSNLVLQSLFISDEMLTRGSYSKFPLEASHFPLIEIKNYDTHTHYLVQLYNHTKNNLELNQSSIVLAPKEYVFFPIISEPPRKSYWEPFSHIDFDYFPPLSHQQKYSISSEVDLQCPKDFDLVFDSKTPKCTKSEYLIKLIENKLKN